MHAHVELRDHCGSKGRRHEREGLRRPAAQIAIESVNLWKFEGHDNPEQLKKRVISQINAAWNGIIKKRARSVSG